MGLYINETPAGPLPPKGKAEALLRLVPGAKLLPAPPLKWQPGLVVVVDNGPWEAAAYADSQTELDRFLPSDGRRKWWLTVPNARSMVS